MSQASILEREEYIEQAYFFRTVRERMDEEVATQEILNNVHEEILSTTRLPMAIQFLASELKHTGLLSSGFRKLSHYFTAFQAFVMAMTEVENHRFDLLVALLVLEREAEQRAKFPSRASLFTYQFEVLCRNRLGYHEGLQSMGEDPYFDEDWRRYLRWVYSQMGAVDIAELIYARSENYVLRKRREQPSYEPPVPPLFGEKEGKIALANVGRDPLYLFAALQRQLGYPEVPRPRSKEDVQEKMTELQNRVHDLEQRLKLLESEMRGQVDLSQFGKPELLKDD